MYAIVDSTKLDAYLAGNATVEIDTFATLDEARAHAEEIACEYHYGVEIVDDDGNVV